MPTKDPLTNDTSATGAGRDGRTSTKAARAVLATCDRAPATRTPARKPARCKETTDKETKASRIPAGALAGPRRKHRRTRRAGGAPGRREGWKTAIDKAGLDGLLQATPQPLVCALVLGLGLRPSDVARLERQHVVRSDQGLKLYIDREGAARTLPADIRSLLTAHLNGVSPGTRPLFVSRFNTPLSANAIQQQIRRTGKRLGLELTSSAGRRAKLQEAHLCPVYEHPMPPAGASESMAPASIAAIEKVELYRATIGQTALPVGSATRPNGCRPARGYR